MKPLARAKLRLGPALSAAERRALSLAMLSDVVAAAVALDAVWVLNSDPEAAAVARAGGAQARPDPAPGAGLNASLTAATAQADEEGARGVLVLSADLPGASPEDVEALAAREGIAIAPDRSGSGTNALWRTPPGAIPLAFGSGSRAAHEAAARARGLACVVLERPGLALDLDSPEDLDAAWDAGVGPATRDALSALGYPLRRRR